MKLVYASLLIASLVWGATANSRKLKASCVCAQYCDVEGVCAKDGKRYCNECILKCYGTAKAIRTKPTFTCDTNCTDLNNPVCGADGQTYMNACQAYTQHTTVERLGVCVDVGTSGCKDDYDPVCDRSTNTTYGNECVAKANMVTNYTAGPCVQPQFCNYLVYQPTCGADGHTYGAGCEAENAGTTVLHDGRCTWKECGCTWYKNPVRGSDGKMYANQCQADCAGAGN